MIWFFSNRLFVSPLNIGLLRRCKVAFKETVKLRNLMDLQDLKQVYIWKYIENIILSFDIVVFQFLYLGSCFMAIYKKTIHGEFFKHFELLRLL